MISYRSPLRLLRRLTALGLLALVWGTTGLNAQVAPCLRRSIPVTVLDREGNSVAGLTVTDFQAKFRGQPVKILSATRDTGPRRIVILLDTSGSMLSTPGKFQFAHAAAADVVRFGPPDSQVALVVFASDDEQKVGFTEGDQAVRERLAALKVEGGGRTALLDAVGDAFVLLDPARVGDVVYAITDGGENRSDRKREQVEQALLCAGVRLFALFFRPYKRLPDDMLAFGAVRGLTEATGGSWSRLLVGGVVRERYVILEKQRAVVLTAARKLYLQMGEFYRVEVELPRAVEKPRKWKLEVVDGRGKRRKKLKVIYPRRLMPCQSHPAQP